MMTSSRDTNLGIEIERGSSAAKALVACHIGAVNGKRAARSAVCVAMDADMHSSEGKGWDPCLLKSVMSNLELSLLSPWRAAAAGPRKGTHWLKIASMSAFWP
jgi:hypothetical protein